MGTDTNQKKADQDKKPDQQTGTKKIFVEKPINRNPDQRANENLTEKDRREAPTGGVGSEITDGEDG